MVVKGRGLVGPLIGIIASVILLIAGAISFMFNPIALQNLEILYPYFTLNPTLLTLRSLLTIVLACLGLSGAIIVLYEKKVGLKLMVVGGLIASIGVFVPIVPTPYIPIGYIYLSELTLTYSMFWADAFFILVGGILGLTLKRD